MAVSPEPSLKLLRNGPVGAVYREAQQCRIDIEELARHECVASGPLQLIVAVKIESQRDDRK